MKRGKLTPQEHVELGLVLKQARALIHEAARMTRMYGRLSRELYDAADALMKPRAWLTQRLIEDVGDGLVEGVPAREVYFGELEREDA
jgi:hypothetical protein